VERKGDNDSMDMPGELGNTTRERSVEGEILARVKNMLEGKILMREENVPEGETVNLEMDHDSNRISTGTDQDQDLDNIKTYLKTGMCPPHLTHAEFQCIHQQVLHFFLQGGRLWQ